MDPLDKKLTARRDVWLQEQAAHADWDAAVRALFADVHVWLADDIDAKRITCETRPIRGESEDGHFESVKLLLTCTPGPLAQLLPACVRRVPARIPGTYEWLGIVALMSNRGQHQLERRADKVWTARGETLNKAVFRFLLADLL